MKRRNEFNWTHHEENDIAPEHYSSPFGLIIWECDISKWGVWLLNSARRFVGSAEELELEEFLGNYSRSQLQYAKYRVQEQVMPRAAVLIAGAV